MTTLSLVVAQFYDELANKMEKRAREYAAERDAKIAEAVPVPGVYDAPLAADRLARQEDITAVAVLGTVVTGDTDHDQVVVHTTAQRLADVSLNRDTPVAFGVNGPNLSAAEAHERVDYGANAVNVALDLTENLPNRA
jgi:6,7-dimethyl-8-ribityllumazine synthase